MNNSLTQVATRGNDEAAGAGAAALAGGVILSMDQVAEASHPAILRALEDILRDGDKDVNFSNFYSHQSFGNISNAD